MLALAVFAVQPGIAPPAMAGDPAWRVIAVSGDAQLRAGLGEWRRVSVGAAVTPGAKLRTGAEARVVLKRDNDTVTVSPDSRIAVPAAKKAGAGANFLQSLGTILFDIEHDPSRHFEVDTPYLAAVVKGTAFTVTVRPGGGAVQVTRGAVQVASMGTPDIALVRPGQIARVPSRPGAHMTITEGGHTMLAPRTGKTKAQLEEPDPAPKAADKGAAHDAAAPAVGPTVAATRAPNAGRGLALGHAVAASATGLGGRHGGDAVVIDRTLGEQKLDIAAATGGLVAAAPAAPTLVKTPRAGNGAAEIRSENGNGNGNARAFGHVAAEAVAAVPSEGAQAGGTAPVAAAVAPATPPAAGPGIDSPRQGGAALGASVAAGNPGHGGSPPGLGSGPSVVGPAVSAPAGNAPVVSTPAVSTPAVAPPAVSTASITPPSVSAPAVTPPVVTPPEVTPPATPGNGRGNGLALGRSAASHGHGR